MFHINCMMICSRFIIEKAVKCYGIFHLFFGLTTVFFDLVIAFFSKYMKSMPNEKLPWPIPEVQMVHLVPELF